MENKIGSWMLGTILATFIGMIFLVSTMTGFLPYHEQTKQVQLITQAQVEIAQIEANKQTELAEILIQKEPIYWLGSSFTWLLLLCFGLGFIIIVLVLLR